MSSQTFSFYLFMGVLAAILIYAMYSLWAFRRHVDKRLEREAALKVRVVDYNKRVAARNLVKAANGDPDRLPEFDLSKLI